MDMKCIFALFGLIVLGSVVFAIGGATAGTQSYYDRWAAGAGVAAGGTATVEGGNISDMNITASSLTDRWAAVYGNVSGSIVLRDNTNLTARVYEWTGGWDPAGGGEVCMSTGGSYDFAAVTSTTGVAVDTAFGLGAAADNATNTYNDSYACGLDFDDPTPDVATSAGVTHMDGSYWTCAVIDGVGTAEANFAFCTEINSAGLNFKGESAMYEIMVPTTPAGTETYYFYAELG